MPSVSVKQHAARHTNPVSGARCWLQAGFAVCLRLCFCVCLIYLLFDSPYSLDCIPLTNPLPLLCLFPSLRILFCSVLFCYIFNSFLLRFWRLLAPSSQTLQRMREQRRRLISPDPSAPHTTGHIFAPSGTHGVNAGKDVHNIVVTPLCVLCRNRIGKLPLLPKHRACTVELRWLRDVFSKFSRSFIGWRLVVLLLLFSLSFFFLFLLFVGFAFFLLHLYLKTSSAFFPRVLTPGSVKAKIG